MTFQQHLLQGVYDKARELDRRLEAELLRQQDLQREIDALGGRPLSRPEARIERS